MQQISERSLCPGLVLLQMSILESGERVAQARPREGAPPSHTTGDNRRTHYMINSRPSNLAPDALEKRTMFFLVSHQLDQWQELVVH
jgi:hypothetical protein